MKKHSSTLEDESNSVKYGGSSVRSSVSIVGRYRLQRLLQTRYSTVSSTSVANWSFNSQHEKTDEMRLVMTILSLALGLFLLVGLSVSARLPRNLPKDNPTCGYEVSYNLF